MQKTAVVTGVTGQDGAYLTGLLLEKGYRVFGTFRRSSSVNFWRLKQLELYNAPGLELVEHDVTDLSSSFRLIQKTNPDEVYNLAAQSFVGVSFDQPVTTGEINAFGVLNLLEAIRLYKPNTKFYQASTSEMFGKVQSVPQNENTPFYPRSPYGVAKLYAHWISINYRESYGIFACSGILFNHESPLRGLEFVTRKITDAVARIKLGLLETLELGNLSARRDWGYAREYVAGMWQMMQAEEPGTFVLSSGRSESVRDFVSMAFQTVGFSIDWQGRNDSETGICRENGQTVVKVTPKFYRPAEVDLLIGDSAKARQILGWQANTTLEDLCKMMVESDLARLENTAAI